MPKGGGYWIWKHHIIENMLNEMAPNDILIYCDAGASLNLNYKALKRFNEYIYLEDTVFLSDKDAKFISSANRIISNEKCIHLITTDSALYYLLRKPSCTRFYFSWSIGSKRNQILTVEELKSSDTNIVVLSGFSDNWSSSYEIKHPIIFEFINNNFKKKISLKDRVLIYK